MKRTLIASLKSSKHLNRNFEQTLWLAKLRNHKTKVSQGSPAILHLSGNGMFWDYKWMDLLDELNWKKKLFDEGFLDKNLLLPEKTIYCVQTNALKK